MRSGPLGRFGVEVMVRRLFEVLKQTPVLVPGSYALLAALWIFFSDRVLEALVREPARLTQMQTYKGWFFVATTTLLLAALIYWRQRALNELNASLERRVLERTEALQAANEVLRHTLEEHRQMQDQLVNSEKLAALGALVAGVAHELNTPIGNCLMVASTLEENTQRLLKASESGTLKKSALQAYLGESALASGLVVRNMTKASDLVGSFKQVAVDRSSSRQREFSLAEVVNETLVTLSPGFKKLPVTIRSEVPDNVRLDSFPGPLGQVLGNLVNNAVIHGLDGGHAGGEIVVLAQQLPSGEVEILVRDNGVGIPPELVPRIFDPFFTTRFGQGGSGLGLHIAHQLVTNVLGGTISVRSRPGEGAEFRLLLPRLASASSETQ